MTAALVSLALTMTATADELNKEITVEKEIVPQEREAQRLTQLPKFSLPAVETKKLQWSDRAVAAPLTHDITVLAPAAYAASMERSPYRGYIDAGYFPSMQAGVSAGYRFIDSGTTRLGAWLQYDGSDYKRANPAGNKLSYRDHTASIGLTLRHSVDDVGTFDARVAYSLSSFDFPTLESKGFSQMSNTIGLGLGWEGHAGRVDYSAVADYGFFNFSKPTPGMADLKALSENYGRLGLGAAYRFDGRNSAGADISVALAHTSNSLSLSGSDGNHRLEAVKRSGFSHGHFSVTPYYRHKAASYSIKLGLQFYSTWGGDNGFRVAPDISADWSPSGVFAIYARLHGGNPSINTVSSLFAANHYINPSFAYSDSRSKWMIDAGFILGPFSGASIEVWGSAGKAANVVMPVVIDSSDELMGVYAPVDMTVLRYGVAFSYRYRDIASLRVSYEGAPQEYGKGSAMWLDRAKHVVGAAVSVTPVRPLDIALGYTLRSGRAVYAIASGSNLPFGDTLHSRVGLGDAGSLDFEASYRFSPAFTLGARVENLLNDKWQTVYGIPCKGVTGLVGIGYRF